MASYGSSFLGQIVGIGTGTFNYKTADENGYVGYAQGGAFIGASLAIDDAIVGGAAALGGAGAYYRATAGNAIGYLGLGIGVATDAGGLAYGLANSDQKQAIVSGAALGTGAAFAASLIVLAPELAEFSPIAYSLGSSFGGYVAGYFYDQWTAGVNNSGTGSDPYGELPSVWLDSGSNLQLPYFADPQNNSIEWPSLGESPSPGGFNGSEEPGSNAAPLENGQVTTPQSGALIGAPNIQPIDGSDLAGFEPIGSSGVPGFQPIDDSQFSGFQPIDTSGLPGFQPVDTSGLPGFEPVDTSGLSGFQPVDTSGLPGFQSFETSQLTRIRAKRRFEWQSGPAGPI